MLVDIHLKLQFSLKIDMHALGGFELDQPITGRDYIQILNRILKSDYGDYKELLEEGIINDFVGLYKPKHKRAIRSINYLTSNIPH